MTDILRAVADGNTVLAIAARYAHERRTLTTTGHQALLTGETIDVDDVLFRMLEPSEVKRAMDFPTEYVMLGNRREQVKLSGNAVTPCAARDLVWIVAEALA